MSRLRIFSEDDAINPLLIAYANELIAEQLKKIGVRFEQWQAKAPIQPGASSEEVFAAYQSDIDKIVKEKGFRSVDVVSIAPDDPEREAKRKKFLDEHFHKEDEVRFFVAGSGLFTLHVENRVYEILCTQGDLIGVPDSTKHWFDMGPAPYFVAIRFFTEADGWVGHFTGSDWAQKFPRFEAGEVA
jgi:1,2-dihydroxy-3-keto-5-methylthiopentene dioxygenase